MKVGILGAGVISEQYLTNLIRFPELDVVFVADVAVERARSRAEQFGVPTWGCPQELLDSDTELVVNLTPPQVHYDSTIEVLQSGRHVWLEKPLATSVAHASQLLHMAAGLGLTIGCAPDTLLGRPAQIALHAIASGAIGEPSWAFAAFETAGPQGWHPSPEFLFSPGGGPVMDMGPYYLTFLAHVFGPVVSVQAAGATAQRTRTIGSGPRAGQIFPVTVDSTSMAILEYADRQRATVLFSFDSGVRRAVLEVTGAAGTIVCADPNAFVGTVELRSSVGQEPRIWPTAEAEATRGIGVVDMVRAISGQRPPFASAQMAAHLVEVFAALEASAMSGLPVKIVSRFESVALPPEEWDPAAIPVP